MGSESALVLKIERILEDYLPQTLVSVALMRCEERTRVRVRDLTPDTLPKYVDVIQKMLVLFGVPPEAGSACARRIRELGPGLAAHEDEDSGTIAILTEQDVLRARDTVRRACRKVGFSPTEEIKLATAASELARNIVRYAKRGLMHVIRLGDPRPGVELVAEDKGPGIVDLELVLSGRYKSLTGMGMGLLGVKRLTDSFHVATSATTGTTVTVRKFVR